MKRDVVEKPVIRKNQIVEVVANRGALTITMKAQALESGAVKALIRMRNLDSKREFNAQVIDETRANVVF
jgi:flagella basal body P-ring formation protein FlgA